MKEELNVCFKFSSIKDWFNQTYFICLYDKQDNYITSFDNLEDLSLFLNKSIGWIIDNLRRGLGIVYDHKRYKLICFEKDKDDDLVFGGNTL